MLFRNGYKAIFSMREPGRIAITYSHMGSAFFAPGKEPESIAPQEDFLESQWGAFGKVNWVYQGQPVAGDHMVKYYLTKFIRESAK